MSMSINNNNSNKQHIQVICFIYESRCLGISIVSQQLLFNNTLLANVVHILFLGGWPDCLLFLGIPWKIVTQLYDWFPVKICVTYVHKSFWPIFKSNIQLSWNSNFRRQKNWKHNTILYKSQTIRPISFKCPWCISSLWLFVLP